SGSSTVALASARVSDGAATRVHASGGLDAGAGSVRGTGGGVDASGSGPQLVRSTTTNPGSSSARRAGSGGRPHVRRPRRRRDAGLAHARSQPDASKNSTTPDAGAPKPKKTMLRVRIGPFCKAFIDGKAVGDSPDGPWHQVSPGPHTVRCVHPITSRTVTRTVTLAPGQRFDLVATMTSKVRVALAAGDAVKINQRLYHQGAALHVPLKRVEVVVFKGGRVLTRGWRTLRDGCVLTDSPRLGCK
ncbi:MAG: hypothetical protein KC503_17655, partial [Myxococcales bacterium]|nr:hypothetical protein [Myxococcales bacterium]